MQEISVSQLSMKWLYTNADKNTEIFLGGGGNLMKLIILAELYLIHGKRDHCESKRKLHLEVNVS